jgi:hypothetical protein
MKTTQTDGIFISITKITWPVSNLITFFYSSSREAHPFCMVNEDEKEPNI